MTDLTDAELEELDALLERATAHLWTIGVAADGKQRLAGPSIAYARDRSTLNKLRRHARAHSNYWQSVENEVARRLVEQR